MKVFLDVGAHVGQTLTAALRYDFDRIVCFEPAVEHIPALKKLADKRTEIAPFGLWKQDMLAALFNIGTQGASLWRRPDRPTTYGLCKFVRVSDWLLANVAPDDEVWMKLNVEGAELDVVEDMLDSGTFGLVAYMQIMWDSLKIPELAERGAAVRARVESLYKPPHVIASKVVPTAPTSTGRVDNWLAMTGMYPRA
jgi:FkbM family methyltransferase